jgi:phage/plasmid-associated DNA primase
MLYQLTLQATESEQEASDALEQWMSNVCKDGQDTKTVVNLDTVNIIAGLGSLLVKDNG